MQTDRRGRAANPDEIPPCPGAHGRDRPIVMNCQRIDRDPAQHRVARRRERQLLAVIQDVRLLPARPEDRVMP